MLIMHATDDGLSAFCQDTFGTLARSDQRRCAEAYVRGLIHGSGRRSTRRIATELAGPHSGQALQQFVNQSPWNPGPVRTRIAELAAELAFEAAAESDSRPAPTAWILEEVAFPKNGRCSAAVERQFVPNLGKVMNAQLAAVLTLTTPELSVPVDWRLSLPASWDQDERRRGRAHIPADQRHRPYWEYLVDLVDEMTVERGFSAAPVVVDLSQAPDAQDFLLAMLDRGLGHVVGVSPRQRVRTPLRSPLATGRPAAATDGVPLADLIARAGRHLERRTVTWRGSPDRRSPRSQFLIVPIQLRPTERVNPALHRPMQALVEWPLGRSQPRAFWLTDLVGRPVEELVHLAKLNWRSRLSLTELTDRFGLCDYEGRSFPGWHHHVTLASAAYVYQLSKSLRSERRTLASA